MRISDCEIGPICHRAGTALLPPGRCARGHVAPRYGGGGCVACAKLAVASSQPRQSRRNLLRRFLDLAEARAWHEECGGWLLDLGGGLYGATDNESIVLRRRGTAWLDRCERLRCWDETAMRPGATP